MDVMVGVAKEGHFAAEMIDLVFNPATGMFENVSGPSAPPAGNSSSGQMDIMKSVAKEGHFVVDMARLQAEAQALNQTFPTLPKTLSTTEAKITYKGKCRAYP
jgi:hypothetical protein